MADIRIKILFLERKQKLFPIFNDGVIRLFIFRQLLRILQNEIYQLPVAETSIKIVAPCKYLIYEF